MSLNKNTAYSANEAEKIGSLSWYKDKCFVQEIIDLVHKYHTNDLYDICCGAGGLYPEILSYYNKIYAIDLSKNMLETNKINNYKFKEKIEYICSDAIEYIKHNMINIEGNDILLKNCLQLLDLSKMQILLQSVKFQHLFLINTINTSDYNFFHILEKNDFDFVHRTYNYITENVLDSFCNNIGWVIKTKIIEQKMNLTEWLFYHGSKEDKIFSFYNILNDMEGDLLEKYNIVIEKNDYVLKRYEKIYCICK